MQTISRTRYHRPQVPAGVDVAPWAPSRVCAGRPKTTRDPRRVRPVVSPLTAHTADIPVVAPRSTRVRRAEIYPERSRRPVSCAASAPLAAVVGVRGTRCPGGAGSIAAGRRRLRALLAVVVGVGLALAVWSVWLIGSDYQDARTPQPVATQVVHVRDGESLSGVAARVAPDVPSSTVVDELVDLNHLDGASVGVGQTLLAPRYS